MKKSVASILITGAVLCLTLNACKDKEESNVPDLKVPAKAQAPAQDSEPALQSMQSLAPAKATGSAKAAPISNADVVPPGNNGSYVIQVGLKPSKSAANAIVKQLAQNNISAYIVEVINPGELEGTYYRVRIGYFRTPAKATAYAQSVISPLGMDGWWVDDKANDAVNGPYEGSTSESTGGYSNSNSNAGDYNSGSTSTTATSTINNNSSNPDTGSTSSSNSSDNNASSTSGYSVDTPASSAMVMMESSSSFEESSSSAAPAPAAPAAVKSDTNSYDDWE